MSKPIIRSLPITPAIAAGTPIPVSTFGCEFSPVAGWGYSYVIDNILYLDDSQQIQFDLEMFVPASVANYDPYIIATFASASHMFLGMTSYETISGDEDNIWVELDGRDIMLSHETLAANSSFKVRVTYNFAAMTTTTAIPAKLDIQDWIYPVGFGTKPEMINHDLCKTLVNYSVPDALVPPGIYTLENFTANHLYIDYNPVWAGLPEDKPVYKLYYISSHGTKGH